MKNIKLTALGLTGSEWITRLEGEGYRIGTYAKQLLNSLEYDKHRMEKGEAVEVAFVSVKDMGKKYATTDEIRAYAAEKGYLEPKAELALLIRESMTDEAIESLGAWYVATFHEPIKDSDGDPGLLYARRRGDGRWVDADWGRPGDLWSAEGAFAVLVPASSTSSSEPAPSLDSLPLESRVEALERFYDRVIELIPSLEDMETA